MRLHDLVSQAARRAPGAPAVVSVEGTLTYGELDALAERFASALRARGVRPGDRVVLWTGKSTLAVAFMQGSLRAGAVYVPVTAANPPARVRRIAVDCDAALVVADAAVPDAGLAGSVLDDESGPASGDPAGGGRDLAALDAVVPLEALLAEAATPDGLPAHDNAADDPAYILYTSGSTGTPKGVCLSHRNALAFIDWAVDLVGVEPGDRLSNHAPFNFDLSVFDLYAAFRAGASVYLVSPEMAYAPTQLAGFIREQGITIWYSVPSALALMMREGLLEAGQPPALRACVFAGEPFAIGQVQALRKAWPGVRLFNWYGPTETNVCTGYEVTDADLARSRPLPIGTAASGDTITLVPMPGAPRAAAPGDGGEYVAEGEIVVTGPTVMLGYWGRPPHEGPYRTGDLGRLAADGNIEYAGRIDHMVKVRGNRVELGEVEAAVAAHPAVAHAAVVVVGEGLEARLHAVVVAAEGATAPRLLEIKLFCSRRLPTYMLPDALHVTGALPLTPNGKTDRSALAVALAEPGGL